MKTEESAWEPKIVGFLCQWCSYAGADLAGSSRFTYPPNVRVIRVPCSGRVNPLYILRAFKKGADGVLVAGCHPGDCHYNEGNYYARRRLTMLGKILGHIGIEPERFRLEWVSASEGGRFADVIKAVAGQVKKLGPLELRKRKNG
ncbi:MAG: hydrogenase iron-sulfur subunit [Candidatus Eremiobacteraeota bacterium]|nr:hydrogenase iron-sulfur subunit [Candidatus Eremiobacteraeota bacterium]